MFFPAVSSFRFLFPDTPSCFVSGSSSVDQKVARLSPGLFGKGNMLVLFLVRDVDHNYISAPESVADNAVHRFIVPDPNCGALSAIGKRFDHIKALILASPNSKGEDK